jgi:DNA-binding FrmR family transcriptional regulator
MASLLLAARNLAADRTRLGLTVVVCSRGCRTEFLGGCRSPGGSLVMTARTTPWGYIEQVPGYRSHKEQVQGRLRRIEGQVRGLQKMVDEDRYCIDVLTQVSAVKAALDAVALLLLQDHTEHCVVEAIQAGDGSPKIRELNEAVERLVKG